MRNIIERSMCSKFHIMCSALRSTHAFRKHLTHASHFNRLRTAYGLIAFSVGINYSGKFHLQNKRIFFHWNYYERERNKHLKYVHDSFPLTRIIGQEIRQTHTNFFYILYNVIKTHQTIVQTSINSYEKKEQWWRWENVSKKYSRNAFHLYEAFLLRTTCLIWGISLR